MKRPGTARPRHLSFRSLGWFAVLAMVAGSLFPTSVLATKPPDDGEHKVTICHRTNSVTNPYVEITVDFSGADGGLVHDNGNGDHTNHLGPVFDPATVYPPPHNGDQWGDIIPPYSWPGDQTHDGGSYPGLNWPAGKAILDNHCDIPPTPTPTPATPTPTPTPEITPTPATPTPTPEITPTPATPTPTPTPGGGEEGATPTPTPTPTPQGGVSGATGTPKHTLPPTDTAPALAAQPSSDGWRIVLLGLAAILATVLLLTPVRSSVRRR